ncbi:transposase [Methanothrix soehngenii]|uniref:transposase n=1 Tax=Methanothrix soehngenii TaxID=2223 RepID=UPI003AB92331
MKPKIMPLADRLMLKKRSLVESVFHILKDMLHIDHSRHRSPQNILINILAALTAYCFYPNKPTIRWKKLICLTFAHLKTRLYWFKLARTGVIRSQCGEIHQTHLGTNRHPVQ